MTDAADDPTLTPAPAPRTGPWAFATIIRLVTVVVIFVVFSLFYGYATWAGWGNFLGIQNQRLQLGLNLTPLGWFVIIADVAIPALAFIAIFLSFFIHATLAVRHVRPIRVGLWFGLLLIGVLLVAVINLDLVLGVPQTAMFDIGSAG